MAKKQELVKQEETTAISTQVAAPAFGGDSQALAAFGLTQEDVQFPRLRIAQGLTPEVADGKARAGDLLITGAEPMQAVVIVPFMVRKTREMLKKGSFDRLCHSDDTHTGIGNPGGACATCPMAQWGTDADGKGIPPACSVVYTFGAWALDASTHDAIGPVVFSFKKTSANAAKQINMFAMMNGWGGFGLRVTTKKTTKGVNIFQEPVLASTKIEPEVLAMVREFAKGMVGTIIDDYDTTMEQGTQAATDEQHL